MPAHELSKLEKQILSQLSIKYGMTLGRPSNKKRGLIATIAAIDAYLQKKQIKEATNEQPANPTTWRHRCRKT